MARVVDEVSEEMWCSNNGDFAYLYAEYLGVIERMRVKRSSSWAFSKSRAFLYRSCQHSTAHENERCSRAYSNVPFS